MALLTHIEPYVLNRRTVTTLASVPATSRLLLVTIVIVITILGCSRQAESINMPEVLTIGVLPDESKQALLNGYTPLFQYLSDKLDVQYRLSIPANYEDLLSQFNKGEIDMAYFGGFTFIQALHSSSAVPIVMRDIDIRFTSYFIAKGKTSSNHIKDFKGKNFSFGSRLSTSGHLMPRFFLAEKKIIPETLFGKVKYSGSHDKTTNWVRDGIVDIGVANSKIVDKMIKDGRLKPKDIQIIWETPPYPDYVWAIQSSFEKTIISQIRNAFLSLSPANEKHAAILAGVDAGGYLPASVADFSQLVTISKTLGLLGKAPSRQ